MQQDDKPTSQTIWNNTIQTWHPKSVADSFWNISKHINSYANWIQARNMGKIWKMQIMDE